MEEELRMERRTLSYMNYCGSQWSWEQRRTENGTNNRYRNLWANIKITKSWRLVEMCVNYLIVIKIRREYVPVFSGGWYNGVSTNSLWCKFGENTYQYSEDGEENKVDRHTMKRVNRFSWIHIYENKICVPNN